MDKLTQQIAEAIQSERKANGSFTEIGDLVFEGGNTDRFLDYFSWSLKTSIASPLTGNLSIRYYKHGSISIRCQHDVVVIPNEKDEDRWVISYVQLKGTDIDRDFEVVLRQADRKFHHKDKFLPQSFIRIWPHLDDYVALCQNLCLVFQDCAFECLSASTAALPTKV